MPHRDYSRTEQARKPSWLLGRVLVFLASTALLIPSGGCSGSLSGTSGDEGSFDLSSAKEAAKSNPDIAKAAGKFGGGVDGAPKKKGTR